MARAKPRPPEVGDFKGMKETCYMCNELSIGREHVPPRCLFPESKDLPGTNYRKNLITVPSCDIHNSAKSKDDEYMMAILTTYILNDPVANEHIDTKVVRTLNRTPKLAAGLVEGGGVLSDGLAYLGIESKRIFNVCEHIAKGLFFHQFKRKSLSSIQFLSPALLPNNENARAFYEESNKCERYVGLVLDQARVSFCGANPDIFKYRLIEAMDNGLVVQLVFYNGVCVSGISRAREVEL